MKRNSGTVENLVSIIIPIRNEQWCVTPLIRKLEALIEQDNYKYEVIFVDGDSDDDTFDVLDNICNMSPEIRVLRLTKNFGVMQAIIAGVENSTGEYVVTIDGNLQNDPNDIPRLIDELISNNADICLGWRSEDAIENPGALTRELPNKKMNSLISFVTGVRFNDHECSLKAYRYSCLDGIGIYGNLHHYIHLYASMYGAKICEIKVNQFPRAHGHGERENPLKRVVKKTLDLILLGFFIRYAQRPLYVFGSLGIFSIISGLLAFTLMFFLRFFGYASFIETPLPTVTVAFVTVGILLILVGILSEFVVRIFFEVRQQSLYKLNTNKYSRKE